MPAQASSDNKRIAKNTMFLYIRMGILMLVQLYTSRIILSSLGVDDYGIYNIVGSIIVSFSFISNPLSSATQRFYNFELGRNDKEGVNRIFNHGILIYSILTLLLLCIIEIAGMWFIYNKMQLPASRLDAAIWAFHFSALSFGIGLIKIPFESLIVAHEKMDFYAYVSIADVLLKLLNAFSLLYFTVDKLKLYAVNQVIISVIVLGCIMAYCKISFGYLRLKKDYDKTTFSQLLGFSGWSLFGSVASMTANQGLNILLNMFFGVAINAAMGIATQINGAVNQFVGNFQIAFRPQIVKSYAANEICSLHRLIFNTSKYSYLLLLGLICPISMNMDYILRIWLKNVPPHTSEFAIFMLIYALLETLSAPMWMTVQATGKIRNYQLVISSLMFMNIILSYVFLKMGYPPSVVLIIKCLLDVSYLTARLCFMHKMINFPVRQYLTEVISHVGAITIICTIVVAVINMYISQDLPRLFWGTSIFMVVYCASVYYIALTGNERSKITKYLLTRI